MYMYSIQSLGQIGRLMLGVRLKKISQEPLESSEGRGYYSDAHCICSLLQQHGFMKHDCIDKPLHNRVSCPKGYELSMRYSVDVVN